MDDLIRELREIKEQIRRDHDPDRMQRAIRDVITKSPTPGAGKLAAMEAASGPTRSLHDVITRPARTERERELQYLNDRVYLCSRMLRRDPRQLKSYHALAQLGGELCKALNTDDNSDFVPDGFSAALVEEVRLQRRLPSLFESVTIPRSPLKWPVEGGIGLPYLIGENTSDTGEKIPTRNPSTAGVTFDAKTIGVRVPFSHEFDEDSIVCAEDFIRRQIANALTDGLETAILNGDTDSPHFDGVVTASNDVRRVFKGLRRLAQAPSTNTEYDVTTGTTAFAQGDIVEVRKQMGEYGIDPRELVLIVSGKTYYKMIGDSTNFGDFQTLDKVGPQAINITGEVGAMYGIPVVVSAYAPETCSNAAVDAGTGNDAVFVIANRRAYGLATQVGATIETVWDPEALQFKCIGYLRCDFQPWFSSTTEKAVSVGYNVDVS